MTNLTQKIISRLPEVTTYLAAIIFLSLFLRVALQRIDYPFELEWMEGSMVDHMLRVYHGKSLYPKPSLDFVSAIYPPIYFWISALVAKVVGIGFFPLRLVSLLASLANFVLVFRIVHKETTNVSSGILAAGLFIGTFGISGSWFDIARMDSLFLTFFLGGIYLVRFHFTLKGSLTAALFFSLSILTKQTALPMVACVCMALIIQHRMRALWMCTGVVVLVGCSAWLGHILTEGWFTFHVLTVPGEHVWTSEYYTKFWTHDLFLALPISFTVTVVWLIREIVRGERSTAVFYVWMAAGMVVASWLGRLHTGGFLNVLIPAYLVLAIICGLALASFLRSEASMRMSMIVLVTGLIAFQFSYLQYDASKRIPTELDRLAWQQFVEAVADIDGEVYIAYHGYIGQLAGKRSYAHKMALGDVMRVDSTLKRELSEQLQEEYRKKRFAAVILDAGWQTETLKLYYKNTGGVFTIPNVGYPVTGFRTRPRYFFSPNKLPWE